MLSRFSLLTIYKSFIRPHIDYGDVVFDQSYNVTFHKKLESLQYSAALAITGAIRGTSREKIYQELGLESLQQRRCYRKLTLFFKIHMKKYPSYLFNMIPKKEHTYQTRQREDIPLFKAKHNFFQNSFFPSTIKEWNKIDCNIRKSETIDVYMVIILNIISMIVSVHYVIAEEMLRI